MATRPEALDLGGFSDTQIGVMPLHAVTEVLGPAGLERRFQLELKRFSAQDQELLNKAHDLAMDLHANDRRTREPTTNHVLRVAIRIMHHYGVDDVNLIAAALLHDSPEDHAYEITGIQNASRLDALPVISAEFNPDVATLVGSVTNPEVKEGRDRIEQYQEHVRSILINDAPRVRVLKVSDFTDNALGLIYTPEKDATYRARRYLPLVPAFEEAIMQPDTPLSISAKAYIIAQLEEARNRLSILQIAEADQK